MPRYRFGEFTVDPGARLLLGPQGVADLEPQVFDVLHHLVTHAGRLVTKEELLDTVWGDRFVSESALTTRIKQARRALGDDGRTQWAVQTVHGHGYRFLPEVTVEPSAPTAPPVAAARLPLARAGASVGPPALPDALRADIRQRFCGRRAEYARCAELLPSSAAPRYGWVWILGEPGIGKTRLAAELATEAHARGHRVLFGRNSEDLRVPYQPFVEAIRQATGDPAELAPLLAGDAVVAGAAGSARQAVRADRPPAGEPSPGDESRRYQLFESVAEWLDCQADAAPTLVVLDDIHWAADSTLQLLRHLQRRPSGAAVTFVLTARDTAPDAHPVVADLLAAAQGQATTGVIRLEGLSRDDARELVGEVDDLDQLMRLTAGNPLFLQAVNPADGTVDIPSAVRRRLARLPLAVQEALQLVSVLGLEFELRVAAAALGRDELALLDDLEQAVAARLLLDVGLDRFRFAHALVRSTLRAGLSSARRARLHGRVAVAIDRLHPDDSVHLPELAYHTAEAAQADPALRTQAVDRLRRAAQQSMARFSFREAADLLRQATVLAGAGAGAGGGGGGAVAEPSLRAALALELGDAEARAGRNVIAARDFAAAADLARLAGDVGQLVEAALRYEDAAWRPGQSALSARALVEEAIGALDRAAAEGFVLAGETELRARLAVARLRALAMAGRRDGAAEALAQARRYAAEVSSANLEANALSVYVGQVLFYEDVAAAEPLIARLAELGPRLDDSEVALHALYDRIVYCTLVGRFAQRRALVEAMVELQERSHSSFWRFVRVNQEAMEAFYVGDLGRAEDLAEHCLRLADDLPEEDASGTYGLRMFLIRREQDRLAELAPLVRHVLAQTDGDALWTPGLALLLVETGAPEEAASALAPVRSAGFELPLDAMWATIMVFLAEAMVRIGDAEACALLRQRMARLAGTNITTGSGLVCFGRADRYLGMLSLAMGEPAVAERHLVAALDADLAGGSALWSNESRLWLSRARRAQGHSAEADTLAQVVAREAAAAGLPRLARLASSDLSQPWSLRPA